MKSFLLAILVAVCGAVAAEYVLTSYAQRPAVDAFASTTSRP